LKQISDVKLGFKDNEVIVTAVVDMDHNDKDDLYFVMFNILDDPLRFVVAVAGNFVDFLVSKGYNREEIDRWLSKDPQKYLEGIVQHQVEIMQSANERVKVVIDNQASADQARMVVTSLLAKGHFNQVTTYRFPDGTEDNKLQKVPTGDMARDLKIMLEIIKDWENFDYNEFMDRMVKQHG
jgi:membrane carboxypeptidase/penicillin-binding protein PbpC